VSSTDFYKHVFYCCYHARYSATSKHQIPLKVKKTATEIFNLLCELYGEDTLSTPLAFEWFKKFSERKDFVGNKELRGVLLKIKT
jgi:hypothetical protein